MNGSELPTPPVSVAVAGPDPGSIVSLNDQVRRLQTWLIATLLALLLLSGAFFLFLFRQVSMVRKELDACNLSVEEFQTKRGPFVTNLVARLQSYAQSHSDFIPVLERYGIAPDAAPRPLTPLASPETRR